MHGLNAIRCVVVAALLPLFACGFEAPTPERTPPPPTPAPPLSTISASVALHASNVLQVLNARTRDTITDLRNQRVGCAIASCSLDLEATRTGPITGQAADDALSLTVPLAVRAHLALKSSFFRTSADGDAQGVAHTTTQLALGRDWNLEPHTQGSVTLSAGELKLGPVRMNIADLWNHNEAHLTDTLFKTLDRTIAANVKIRPALERLWSASARPIAVGKNPRAWLALAPEKILVARPATKDDALILSLGLTVRARVIVADQPPGGSEIAPLPQPMEMSAPSDRFAFILPVLLPYDEAARLAMKRFADKPFRVGGSAVHLQSLSILPSGEDVVVMVRICVRQSWDPFGLFDACGAGYLRGVPEFDPKAQTIRIARLHYDVATENLFLSVLHALSGDAFAKAVEPKLAFSVGADIAKLNAEVKDALAKPQGREIRISGEVESFGTPTLTWTRDGFLATVSAEGRVKAEIGALDRT